LKASKTVLPPDVIAECRKVGIGAWAIYSD